MHTCNYCLGGIWKIFSCYFLSDETLKNDMAMICHIPVAMFGGVVTTPLTCDIIMSTGFLSALFAVVVQLHHSTRTGRQHRKEAMRIWQGDYEHV